MAPPTKKAKGKKFSKAAQIITSANDSASQAASLDELLAANFICEIKMPISHLAPSLFNPSHPSNQSYADQLEMEKRVKAYVKAWEGANYHPSGKNAIIAHLAMSDANILSPSQRPELQLVEQALLNAAAAANYGAIVWDNLSRDIRDLFGAPEDDEDRVCALVDNGKHRLEVAIQFGQTQIPVKLYKQCELSSRLYATIKLMIELALLANKAAMNTLCIEANQTPDQRELTEGRIALAHIETGAKAVKKNMSDALGRLVKLPSIKSALESVSHSLPTLKGCSRSPKGITIYCRATSASNCLPRQVLQNNHCRCSLVLSLTLVSHSNRVHTALRDTDTSDRYGQRSVWQPWKRVIFRPPQISASSSFPRLLCIIRFRATTSCRIKLRRSQQI